MVIPNGGEEPLFLNKTGSRIEKDGISFLCVLIKFKGESIGVLSVDRIFKDSVITIDEDIILRPLRSGHTKGVEVRFSGLSGFKNLRKRHLTCLP